jgi:hypothetical protein
MSTPLKKWGFQKNHQNKIFAKIQKHYSMGLHKIYKWSNVGWKISRGCPLITIFRIKKCPFSDAHFSPFQGSFGSRLLPLESLNLLLFGYTPYIPTTDQPLAQKFRLKMIMPKCDVFFRFWITKDVKKIQIDAKNLFKLIQKHFLIILLARNTRWSKWRTHLFPLPELDKTGFPAISVGKSCSYGRKNWAGSNFKPFWQECFFSIFDFLRIKHLTQVGDFSPYVDSGSTVDH